MLVEHLIVSHHGELEFGSPKVPLFPEALLLHHLDNLDSKMECMRALAEKDRHVEGCWTGYNASLERSILKKAKYLEDAAPRAAPLALAASHDRRSARRRRNRLWNCRLQPSRGAIRDSVEPQPRFSPTSSPFAEKLQQAWRKDS